MHIDYPGSYFTVNGFILGEVQRRRLPDIDGPAGQRIVGNIT
jgi:hypothetical protein